MVTPVCKQHWPEHRFTPISTAHPDDNRHRIRQPLQHEIPRKCIEKEPAMIKAEHESLIPVCLNGEYTTL